MNRKSLAFLLVFAVLGHPAWADTLVGAGATLTITNSEDLGYAPIQMGAGATLAFGGVAAGSGGLNEYTRTGAAGLGTPGISSYGTWTRITTNAFWAGTNFSTTAVEYIYTGRWHTPEAGLYSVYEHIDDAALIAIDGRTILQNSSYNTPTCVRDVALTAGWHDLELRVFNGAVGGGMMTPSLASGLLFSPSNDVISVDNQTNAYPFADPGDGSVLQTVHNGTLMQKIYVTDEATFDLSQQNLEGPLSMLAGLIPSYTASGAKVTVAGGTGEILFGTPNQSLHFTPFNADIAFTGVSDPAGVTFRDYSTVVAWPTSCLWRVADNATVALYGTNMLGAGDITLTSYNIYVLSRAAVANDATIHVQGTNRTAFIKPCTLDAYGNWSGSATVLTNNIALEGTGSAVTFPINVDLYVQGSITGTGTVTKTGVARTQIKEPCDFVGAVTCTDAGTFVFESDTAGHSNNTVTVGANASFALYPPGYGASDTTAWIQTLHGVGATNKLYLPAKQTLTVNYLDGTLTVEGAGATLHVNALGTNAVLSVIGQTAVALENVAPGATLKLTGSGTSLAVAGSGVVLDTLNLTAGNVAVSGAFTVSQLTGAGTLVKQGTETLRVNFCTNSTPLRVDAGKLHLAPPSADSVLGDLPALWLDASATNVFTQYGSYTVTNGFLVIERWNDCRPGAPIYGINTRGEGNYQVYPYVMTNNLNGMPVVSMGSFQQMVSTLYGDRVEARRMPLSTNVALQYAIMVFGSQHGGGRVAVGGNANLVRGGSTTEDYRNPATPILSASYPVWTNGVSVSATAAGFSGDYQILTINTQGQSVNALGWLDVPQTAGGQNYGEVLFYTNALSSVQRVTAEAYLAKKWNLPYVFTTAVPSAFVAAGATLELGGSFTTVSLLDGRGEVIVSDGATFGTAGFFAGSVTLSGGTVSIPDQPPPPTAENIPSSALTCWFDPSETNRIVFGGTYTPTCPLTIAALYDRTTTSRYLFGSCNLNLTYDRRPWLSVTNGPSGEPQYWIDYSNVYGDSNGNTLRLYRNPAYIGTSTTGLHTPTNVQTAFIVLDSSRGGGVPITYDVSATQVFTRNNPQSVASPIWGTATATAVKYGQTFLDGVAVNGASSGYSGTTELLSFVATNVVQAAFFGFYGGDGTSGNLNRERLGEILLFESALSDSTRADIEAYLMRKWLGKARAGYSDCTAASVSGVGTVLAAKPSQLPAFDPGFSGTVALSGTAFDYTLATNAAGTYVVSPATVVPGTLAVAAAGSVTVHFAVKPPAGSYGLISCGALTGDGFAGWSLNTTGDVPNEQVRLEQTETALNLLVISPGTMILVH